MNELVVLNLKAIVVVSLAWGVCRATRTWSAATRHAAWATALAGVVLLGVATLMVPSLPLPLLPAVPLVADVPADSAGKSAEPGFGAGIANPSSARLPHTIDVPVSAATQAPSDQGLAPVKLLDGRGNAVVFGSWAFGFAVLMMLSVADLVRLRRITSCAAAAPRGWESIIEGCRARLDAAAGPSRRTRLPDLRLAEAVRVPMVWGLFRPVILLPIAARHWSSDRLEVVLLHELGHVRRGDHAAAWLGTLACAVYWMNPLVWLAGRRMRMEREVACDELVVATGADRVGYATQLLDAVKDLSFSGRAAPGFADRAGITPRIRAILSREPVRRHPRRRVACAAVALGLLSTVPVGAVQLTRAPATAPRVDGAPVAGVSVSLKGTVAELVAELRHGDPTARRRAAWALGDREDPGAVGPLVEAFASPDAELRSVVAWALGEIKRSAAVPALVRRLRDDDSVVREIAARSLGEIEDPRAVDPLIGLLDDAVGDVRAAALWSLGEIGGAAALRAVERGLRDPHPRAWQTAAQSLVQAGSPAALAPLLGRLDDPDPDTRRVSSIYLGKLQQTEAVEPLIALLTDPSAGVRQEATRALGLIGDPRAVDGLIGRLRDETIEVRSLAVWALDETGAGIDAEHPKTGFDDEPLPGVVAG